MECSACGSDDELLYRCEHCENSFCDTHHEPRSHGCSDTPSTRTSPQRATVQRPKAQLFPERAATDGDAAAVDGGTADARPGYEPDRTPPEPDGPPRTVVEWLRRQTYLSLSVKVALVAALCSVFVYAVFALVIYGPLG